MKKILVLFLFSVGCSLYAQQFSADMKKTDIMKVCDAVAKWQINHQKEVKHHPLDWTNGALYRGITEWGKVSGNETCYDFVREIGEKYNWNMWDRVYHADDICVGQAFIEMYRKLGDKRMLQPVMERAYYVATHPSKAPLLKTDAVGTLERWSWADALFGWVFAGLPLIIDNLPIDCDSRNYYIQLFVKMAEAVRKTQCEGGDWRTSLLDPDSYDMPENSCSAFMCYGIAWGLRNEYLAKRTYKPVLEKGWKSLVKAVHTDGKLGYIQPVGAAPKAAGRDATDVYGVGAFLLAGSELYKLIK